MAVSTGALITTHCANYIEPRFMPGYGGHAPSLHSDQLGDTYGNATTKYMQEYRSHVTGGRSLATTGGYFSTYSHVTPDPAVEGSKRSWDRYEPLPRCRLLYHDRDVKEEQSTFSKKCMAHRRQYKDKIGSISPISYFQIAKPLHDHFKHNPFVIGDMRSADDVNAPIWMQQLNRLKHGERTYRSSHIATRAERWTRDKYFENRTKYPRLPCAAIAQPRRCGPLKE